MHTLNAKPYSTSELVRGWLSEASARKLDSNRTQAAANGHDVFQKPELASIVDYRPFQVKGVLTQELLCGGPDQCLVSWVHFYVVGFLPSIHCIASA